MTDIERWKYRVMVLEAKRNLLIAETIVEVSRLNEEIDKFKGFIESKDVSARGESDDAD